jgi:hypothetical protein
MLPAVLVAAINYAFALAHGVAAVGAKGFTGRMVGKQETGLGDINRNLPEEDFSGV